MLRFETKALILKDSFDSEKGWLPVSVREPVLKDFIGCTLPVFVLVDEEKAHNPKPLKSYKVSYLGGIRYQVNDHVVTMGSKWTCDCEFYIHTNGETACPHMLEVMKRIIQTKRWDLLVSAKNL